MTVNVTLLATVSSLTTLLLVLNPLSKRNRPVRIRVYAV